MLVQEIIRRKRDGAALNEQEIEFLVRGITDGSIGDGQIGAFAMAVFIRGMNMDERVALTRAMTASGTVIDWSGHSLSGPLLDKHSTGGVGDKVSLILAPLVAACGGLVPMISGRGLGHTGGTLDKLDAIPGYDTAPDIGVFRRATLAAGCAIVGQTAELAPADRRLYGIRDVTATVESIPLITASILSKKATAGLAGLIMDVKTGSGAFARDQAGAVELAESIVAVAEGAGLPCVALITDMNQVLGRSAGNALEVGEAIAYLTGDARDARLHQVTVALGAELLVLGGLAPDTAAARSRLEAALDSGAAAERFARMVEFLGGPSDLIEDPGKHLPAAPVVHPALPEQPGVITAMDLRRIGLAVVQLGGGRRDPADRIDHGVGLSEVAGLGEAVGPERPLALVHARSREAAEAAGRTLRDAITLGERAAPGTKLIHKRLAGPGR